MTQKVTGMMLIPIFMSKIPEDLKILISRVIGKEVWDIEKNLETFKQELEAREKVNFTACENSESNYEFSGTSLYVNGKILPGKTNRKCPFCQNPGHKPQNCSVVTKMSARFSMIRQQKRCFLCLQLGHDSKNCTAKWKCFSCKGKHHVAICSKLRDKESDKNTESNDDNNDVSTNVAGSENKTVNPVLLQTAKTTVSSADEKYAAKFRLLFDSGSQMSYVTPRVRDILNLTTFGGEITNKVLDVQAFVSEICLPLTNQNIEQAKAGQPFLKDLPLADQNIHNVPLDVDILIGGDYYWEFMNNHMKRSKHGGVTAISSKLGYILSGPVLGTKLFEQSSVNVVNTHVLKVQSEFVSEQKSLECFWDLETLGIKNDEEINFKPLSYSDYESNITYRDKRYTASFPFFEDHEVLEDNYCLAKERLKRLSKKFEKNEKLLKDYDAIIKDQLATCIIEVSPVNYKVGSTHYLPHRPIIREDKLTSKTRIVFDASAKRNGPSLNE